MPSRHARSHSTWALLLLPFSLAGCPDQPGATASQAPKTQASEPANAKTAVSGVKTEIAPEKTKTRTIVSLTKTRQGSGSIPLIRRPVRLPTKRPDVNTPEPKRSPTTEGGSVDLAKVVRAPARLRIGPGAKVGWKARQETRGRGYQGLTWTAIVGEEGKTWHVEHVPYGLKAYEGVSSEASKMILGLVVSKVDGTVIRAVLGKAGEKGQAIRVFELPQQDDGKARAVQRVELELGGKTLPADLREETLEGFGTVRTWTGVGPLAGVLLKSVDPKRTKQLTAQPSSETLTLGGVALSAQRCVYSDGDVTVVTDHPVVRGLFEGVVSMKSGETSLTITAVETTAKAELDWDGR